MGGLVDGLFVHWFEIGFIFCAFFGTNSKYFKDHIKTACGGVDYLMSISFSPLIKHQPENKSFFTDARRSVFLKPRD